MEKNEIFFSKGKKFAGRPLAEEINSLAEGLMYVSESDHPIEFFAGKPRRKFSKREIIKQTEHSSSDMIEENSFENIFNKPTTVRDWYGEEETIRAERFAILLKHLDASLQNGRVFRTGKARSIFMLSG